MACWSCGGPEHAHVSTCSDCTAKRIEGITRATLANIEYLDREAAKAEAAHRARVNADAEAAEEASLDEQEHLQTCPACCDTELRGHERRQACNAWHEEQERRAEYRRFVEALELTR